MNNERYRYRYTLEYWTYHTEWTYEKENRFWHFATMASSLWWWTKQSGMAKYYAMHNYAWAKTIRRFGVRGNYQMFGSSGGRNSISTYGGFFYVYSTLKMAVRSLYLHTLTLVRFYESMDRLVYLRTREMKDPGFLMGSPVMQAAMIREVDNFTRHMQATISFGEGYRDIWNEFGKCYSEFAKSADSRSDVWEAEGFMAPDLQRYEGHGTHFFDFQNHGIDWQGGTRADGGKLHLVGRIQGQAWTHFFGGDVENPHKSNRGLYHLMPQAFDYGHSFRGARNEWNKSGEGKEGQTHKASQPGAYGFLLKFQFGSLGNKNNFRALFSRFFFRENFNRGMCRFSFRLLHRLGNRSETMYLHCMKEGLDPMLVGYAKHLVTLTVLAEQRMFRVRVPSDERVI